MVYSFDGYNYLIRLDKGEELLKSLQDFVAKTKLETAWLNAMGGTLEATIGYYNIDQNEYTWKTYSGVREVVSLQGNITLGDDGKPALHLHGVLSDANFQTVGGHIKQLVVAATLEVFIHKIDKPIHRSHKPDIGLATLDLAE
jgi:predicted DNA-binding protein with PD1-like motif